MNGSGTVTIATTGSSWGGGTTVNSGTLAQGVKNALPGTGLVTVAAPALFHLAGSIWLGRGLGGAGRMTNSCSRPPTRYDPRRDRLHLLGHDPGRRKCRHRVVEDRLGHAVPCWRHLYLGGTTVNGGTLAQGVKNALPGHGPGDRDRAGRVRPGRFFDGQAGALGGAGTITKFRALLAPIR